LNRFETNAVEAADYYDNADVAAMYLLRWGGSDIHIDHHDTGT
jgi:hypothetical protein